MQLSHESASSPDSSAPEKVNGDSSFDTAEFERFLHHVNQTEGKDLSLRSWLHLAEAWRIMQALRGCRGNRSAAARVLGIGRRTLYAKMDKLGITATWGI